MIIKGVVESGKQLGRKLGFPTANIYIADCRPLDNGVYRTKVKVGGTTYDAISNVGTNPTVGGCRRRVESHIFDFSSDIYGAEIEVEILERVRGEVLFESVKALQAQIAEDIKFVKELI